MQLDKIRAILRLSIKSDRVIIVTVETDSKQVNYFKAIVGAIGGAIVVTLCWAALSFFIKLIYSMLNNPPVVFIPISYYMFPIMIGGTSAGAAISLGGRGNLKIAIFVTITTLLAIIIGDFLETAIAFGTLQLNLRDYIEIMQTKISDDFLRLFAYLAGIGFAFLLGNARIVK
jgi:hypothetical protein